MTRVRARLAGFVALVVFFVSLASSGVSASWTAGPQSLTAAPTAASAASTLTGTAALGTTGGQATYQFAGTTSPAIIKPLTITNTGTAPLSYTLSGTTSGTLAPSTVVVSLWMPGAGVCPTTVPTGSGVTTGTLAALPALPTGATSAAPGTSFVMCAATRLTTTVAASQGQSTTVALTLTGRVGSQWTASAAGAAFTQSVFRVADPIVSCKQNSLLNLGLLYYYVTLSWTQTQNSVPMPPITYTVKSTTPGGLSRSTTGLSTDIYWSDLGSSPQTIVVKSTESVYGTASDGVPTLLSGKSGGLIVGLGDSVSCGP